MTAFTRNATDDTGLFDGSYYTNWGEIRNESMNLTDTALVVFTKGFTDTEGLSDSIALSINLGFNELVNGATQDDTVLVQVTGGGTNFQQTAMELVKLTDAAVLTVNKIFTDSMGLSDSATVFRNPALDFTVSDTIGLSDSIAIYHELVIDFENVNDLSGQDDNFSVVLNPIPSNFFAVTPTDPTGLTDNIVMNRNMVLDDVMKVIDTFVLERRRVVMSVDARIG